MVSALIGIHAGFGELAALGFLWIAAELFSFTKEKSKRVKTIAVCSIIFLFISWFAGGYYYVQEYGPVKALIKEGPQPWGHKVITETKEHVFFFIPFLAFFALSLVSQEKKLLKEKKFRMHTIAICFTITLLIFLIAAMGYLISSAARAALEAAA